MKKRDVILDFTSLLDVTLIVIFFFVLFSHLDGQANKIKTEQKVQELELAIEKIKEREAEISRLSEQLNKEISIVRDYSGRHGSNLSELLDYNRSQNFKMILDMNVTDWSIRVIDKGEVIAIIKNKDRVGENIKKALLNAGYDNSETIFCDFVFDGSLPGTASAYRKIKEGIEDVIKEYNYLYTSETDLSIGE